MTSAEVRSTLARLGLSQVQAAKVIGVNPRTVRNWCAEPQRAPVPPNVKLLLQLMEKHPQDWMGQVK